MTSLEQENDEQIIIEKTWNKLEDVAVKAGYRDGISVGRDSNFQNSFDEGYRDGMKTGFTLGLYKGVLSLGNRYDEMLQNISRGNCTTCKNATANIENKSISELSSTQTTEYIMLIEKLQKKYPIEVNIPENIKENKK